MLRERNLRCAAAIGGPTLAVVLLLASFAAARADELSDLRAKEQQLQQQLDELQGVPPAAGKTGSAAPTAPVAGGSFPRSFLIPGTNTSVSIGGSVQTNFSSAISR